jgi:hypothetical protein
MSVNENTLKIFLDDQEVFSEKIGPHRDPWFIIQSNAVNTAELRNLKITGSPTIPNKIDLTAGDDFFTWRNYYDGENWSKRGEEMYHFGGKFQPGYNNEYGENAPIPKNLFPEIAYYYQRPILEDGTIDYEFYYSPEKSMVYPMLDRLVFLIEPSGVKLHWLTDGYQEKSNLSSTNDRVEPQCKRGPDKLPLKEKAWNKLRFQIVGNTVKLSLNGTEIYERPIESTNQRLFGLFHYSDKTEVRVRGMVYEGNWEKQLPSAEKVFEEKLVFSFQCSVFSKSWKALSLFWKRFTLLLKTEN